jgi:thiol-disulfide isomerase/thioredoxin
MKPFLITVMLFVVLVKSAVAQTATVNFNITNPGAFTGSVYVYDTSPKLNLLTKGQSGVVLEKGQSGSIVVSLSEPQYFNLGFPFSSAKGWFSYTLFLSPGDNIVFNADFSKTDNGIVITGKGSDNNQPLIAPLTSLECTYAFYRDTLPYRVIAAINKQNAVNSNILSDYIKLYKPNEGFIKNARLNLAYFAPMAFYFFKENNRLQLQNKGYDHNVGLWQKVQDSLFKTIPLNNDEALSAYNYTFFINTFIEREKGRGWDESENNPSSFYRQWYHTDTVTGKKIFNDEQRSLFIEKVIDKYFSGKTAEYLHAEMIKNAIYESNYQNIGLLSDHFKQKYPGSKYSAAFAEAITPILKKQKQPLTDQMIFVAQNGSKLNSIEEVIAANKGKTVFVDMWGTWCGPCREEIEKHSAALETHFKGKNVLFLYIANYDLSHEQEWKKLIAYYQLEGTHILANEKLTDDIMNKTKSRGFPTYFIIKKDGSYQQTKTQYPVDRQALIKEIELAM